MKRLLTLFGVVLGVLLLANASLLAADYDNRIHLVFEDVSNSYQNRFRDVVFGEGTLAGTLAESLVRDAWDTVFRDPLLSDPNSFVLVSIYPDVLALFVFNPNREIPVLYKPRQESRLADTYYLFDFTTLYNLSQLGKAIQSACRWMDFLYTVPIVAYVSRYDDPNSSLVYQEGFLGVITGGSIDEIPKESVFEDIFVDGVLRLLWYIPKENDTIRATTFTGNDLLRFLGYNDSDLKRVPSSF